MAKQDLKREEKPVDTSVSERLPDSMYTMSSIPFPKEPNEYEISYSKSSRKNGRISISVGTVEVFANSEKKAKEIFREDLPGNEITGIVLIKEGNV